MMLLIVALPMMVPYLSGLWVNEHYRFALFVILAVGWLAYVRWDGKFHAPRGWLSWGVIGFGLLTITVGCLLPSPWFAAIGFVAFATAFLASMEGEYDESLIGLALPLFLIIRLPLGYDQIMVIRLQQITTSFSSVLLDLLAIPHAVANNVLQLTSRELFVAEACSGIQSVFTMLFLATLLIAVMRRPLWLLPVYVLIGVVLAITANVVRVTTVAVGDAWFAVDLAEGWPHELIGYVALILGALLLLSFDQLVVSMLHPVESAGPDAEPNPIIEFWNFMVGHPDQGRWAGPIVTLIAKAQRRGAGLWQGAWSRRGLIAVSTVLLVASFGQAINLQRPIEIMPSSEIIFEPATNMFDELDLGTIGIVRHERTRGGSDPRLGENADVWYCTSDDIAADVRVVLSQPHKGWHELCHCYAAGGWVLLNRVVREGQIEDDTGGEDESESRETFAVARFKSGDAYAYLLYSGIDPQGNVVRPLPTIGPLGSRFAAFIYEPEQRFRVLMIQMIVVCTSKLDDGALDCMASDFVKLRARTQSRIVSPPVPGQREPSETAAASAVVEMQASVATVNEE
jgi:exosortase